MNPRQIEARQMIKLAIVLMLTIELILEVWQIWRLFHVKENLALQDHRTRLGAVSPDRPM